MIDTTMWDPSLWPGPSLLARLWRWVRDRLEPVRPQHWLPRRSWLPPDVDETPEEVERMRQYAFRAAHYAVRDPLPRMRAVRLGPGRCRPPERTADRPRRPGMPYGPQA